MKFLKENVKVIVAFVLGLLLAGGGVFASGQYLASQVDYKNNKTVEDALDDLYSKAQNGAFKKCDIELDDNGHGVIDNIGFKPNTIVCVLENQEWFAYVTQNTAGKRFCFASSRTESNGNILIRLD